MNSKVLSIYRSILKEANLIKDEAIKVYVKRKTNYNFKKLPI